MSSTDLLPPAAASDPVLDLVRRQLGGQDAATGSDTTTELLSLLVEQRQRQLEQSLRQAQEGADGGPDGPDAEGAAEAAVASGVELARLARARIDELAGELDALRDQLDELADALGACPQCWGRDQGCRWCRGRGTPGGLPPDPQAFDRWVLPAVRSQLRLTKSRADDSGDDVATDDGRSA